MNWGETTEETKNFCSGCGVHEINPKMATCGVQMYHKKFVKYCPCRECLIKGVCVRVCYDRENFIYEPGNFVEKYKE